MSIVNTEIMGPLSELLCAHTIMVIHLNMRFLFLKKKLLLLKKTKFNISPTTKRFTDLCIIIFITDSLTPRQMSE